MAVGAVTAAEEDVRAGRNIAGWFHVESISVQTAYVVRQRLDLLRRKERERWHIAAPAGDYLADVGLALSPQSTITNQGRGAISTGGIPTVTNGTVRTKWRRLGCGGRR